MKKKIDKNIEYVVGIDLGHGETSAAICSMQWDADQANWDTPQDIDMGHNRKVMPSAITLLPDGRAFVGEKAFDPEILKQADVHVCFKKKPVSLDGEDEKLMIRFMHEVYVLIRENLGGTLTDSNHVVFIATPSGWDVESQKLYEEMARQAGMPIEGVTKESRAAYIRGMHSPQSGISQKAKSGAIVFDMGSSTLDFTYLKDGRMTDYGYDCGASHIEKMMLEQKEKEDDLKEFEQTYPQLVSCVLYEARKVKEQIYFKSGMKLKKTVHLDELVDDDELDDASVRFVYQPGELNQQLEDNGYIGQIRAAMKDFLENHINNAPIYGVFLTGGASRMDFIIPAVAEVFGVEEGQIARDQDPSLTISQGVAEVARMDLRTSGTDVQLEDMIKNLINGNQIFNTFSNTFSNDLCEKMTEDIGGLITYFGEAEDDFSLNNLTECINDQVEETLNEFVPKMNDYVENAIATEANDVIKKVDNIVLMYSKQGTQIKIPRIKVDTGKIRFDASSLKQVINDICKSIDVDSYGWVKWALTGGGAIFGLLGMAVGQGIGRLLDRTVFAMTEEEKEEKAKNKMLNKEERQSVYNTFADKWDEITSNIQDSVVSAIANNKQLERSIKATALNTLKSYENALREARILVD